MACREWRANPVGGAPGVRHTRRSADGNIFTAVCHLPLAARDSRDQHEGHFQQNDLHAHI